jgi:hypothetical protein
MNVKLSSIVVLFIALLAYIYHMSLSGYMSSSDSVEVKHTMHKFTAERGFFSHDEDPESWDFRATTRPGLGILNRPYPTDTEFDPDNQMSQWQRLKYYVGSLNQYSMNKQYKILYLVRHGQGIHNVKESEVGREEWEVSI